MKTKLTPAQQKSRKRIQYRYGQGKLTFQEFHNRLTVVYDKG